MTANPRDEILKIRGVLHIPAEHQGSNKILEDVNGCAGGFVVVAGVTGGNTFPVPSQPFGFDLDQDTFAVRLAPKGSLERRDKRHTQMMERDGIYFHCLNSY